jgi:hypothetical protein
VGRPASDERLLDRAPAGHELLVLREEVRRRNGRPEGWTGARVGLPRPLRARAIERGTRAIERGTVDPFPARRGRRARSRLEPAARTRARASAAVAWPIPGWTPRRSGSSGSIAALPRGSIPGSWIVPPVLVASALRRPGVRWPRAAGSRDSRTGAARPRRSIPWTTARSSRPPSEVAGLPSPRTSGRPGPAAIAVRSRPFPVVVARPPETEPTFRAAIGATFRPGGTVGSGWTALGRPPRAARRIRASARSRSRAGTAPDVAPGSSP